MTLDYDMLGDACKFVEFPYIFIFSYNILLFLRNILWNTNLKSNKSLVYNLMGIKTMIA